MDMLSICNSALAQLKCRSILDFEENTEEAKQCERYYEHCKLVLLRQFDWPFARKIFPLALTTYENPYWKYCYEFPLDCLNVINVTEQLQKPDFQEELDPWVKSFKPRLSFDRIDLHPTGEKRFPSSQVGKRWEIYYINEAERVVATNIENAFAEYTFNVVNAEKFPPGFTQALVYSLAAELAQVLTADPAYRQSMQELAMLYTTQERQKALRDEPKRVRLNNPILESRYR